MPAIVVVDQAGDRHPHRMLAEIGGEIAEPYPLAQPGFWAWKPLGFRDGDRGSDPASAVELLRRRGVKSQQRKNAGERVPTDPVTGPCLVLLVVFPIANALPSAKPGRQSYG